MKHLPIACGFLIAILSACTPTSSATTAAEAPPESVADGGVILQRTCTVCHNLGGLSAYAGSWGEPQWRSMIETMIAYGAVLTPGEVDTLSRYLGVNFGIDGPPDRASNSDSADMTALVNSACTGCHDLSVITLSPTSFTATEFRNIIQRMIAYGAPVTQDQVEPLVGYLADTYGD